MTDSTDNARGPERIWAESKTCTVDASGASRLLAMDREFSRGTEYIRADLAPDPLADPRVVALVETAKWARNRLETIADENWRGDARDFKRSLVGVFADFDAALAALSPTGGNADG